MTNPTKIRVFDFPDRIEYYEAGHFVVTEHRVVDLSDRKREYYWFR